MAKFFFNVLNDVSTTTDKEWCALPNLQAASQHARKVIGEIMAEELQGRTTRSTSQCLLKIPIM
ncbi:DUF6894 family protein [Sphingomonas faeni]|uniref:DUF6894 family protein n=1 Tax=Sphingomonas faeni TaxID=185950 RepID=UPI003EBED05A